MLPNVLIVGPMRTGTSWAYNYLKTREDVCLPEGVKETFFFDKNYDNGLEWYTSHFVNGKKGIVLEVGPSYFHDKEAPERIYSTLGKIPVIIHKRDPVERSYSHFKHAVRYGYGSDNIQQALKDNPEITTASLYEYQIKRWVDIFGADNVHIIDFNLIAEDPEAYLKELCGIMGIRFKKTDFKIEKKVNAGRLVRSPLLNGMVSSTANLLRSLKLYSLINFAKKMGLKDMVYGGQGLDEDREAEQVKDVIRQALSKQKEKIS